jgi:ABC-type Fe3+ transport system substrate-binding protein
MQQITRSGRLVMLLAGLALIGYAVHRYWWVPRQTAGPAVAGSPAPERKGITVRLSLLYGTEKERWLKAAVEEFARRRPEIGVDLKGMGTVDAVRMIGEGTEKPAIWSPADEIALNLLDAEWSLAKGKALVERSGELAPEPLVVSPLVMIVWEDRARVLAAAAKGDPADWRAVHAVATSPKGWLGIGGPAEWGYVKPGHTAPNASNSGLQTIVLMAYGYHRKQSGLKPADILDEGFQKWLAEVESAVGRFGTSSGTYMKDMVLYGPSKYDFIWNYESVAIGDMAAAQGRWGNLTIHYPNPTLWSNHPFAVLKGDWVSAEQRTAAKELRDFLLSQEIQQSALGFGFRPANPDVKVLSSDPSNPWNRLKAHGIRADVPPVAEAPSGDVARLLLETWRRVVETKAR